jgi:nitrate/nitrite transporter NarK
VSIETYDRASLFISGRVIPSPQLAQVISPRGRTVVSVRPRRQDRVPTTKGEDRIGRNHLITDWNPEDAATWEAGNKDIARRNLPCRVAGALARIYGGKPADRVGGSRVTLGVLGGMILGAGLLATIGTFDDHDGGGGPVAMIGCVTGFIVLFILSGMGNGSAFKMIPSILEARGRWLDVGAAERRHWSRAMSGSLIGFCSAVSALCAVGINLALHESYLNSGTETSAYWMFLASDVGAAILTWMLYVRRRVPVPSGPESVSARV